jgi:RNase adapter protein RapZ
MVAVAEQQTLDVTIISGVSGAGRSATADVLEDLGFFVIDNLPPALIPKVTELGRGREGGRFALVVDTRAGEFLSELEAALTELRESGARTRVLFLDASDEVLVRRFDATRRRHPLADSHRLSDGIIRERGLLEELKGQADIVIDTSELNVHELRDRLRELFGEPTEAMSGLQISVVSFGYKHGLPLDVDLVFDCRFLPNPHWIESLRPLPGTDAKVRRYVMKQQETQDFLEELERLFALLLPAYVREGKSYLSIGVGCTGGNHRSVVIAAEIAKLLERLGFSARVHHRDLDRE